MSLFQVSKYRNWQQFDPKAKSIWTLGKTFESQHVLKQSSGYVSQSTSVPTILRGWATLSTLASVLCLKLVYGWSQLVDITAFFPAIFMSYGLLALWNCWLLVVLFMLGTNRMYYLPLQIHIWSKLDFFDFIVQFQWKEKKETDYIWIFWTVSIGWATRIKWASTDSAWTVTQSSDLGL